MLKDDYIYRCLLQTMTRMLLGFIISFVLAFVLGVIAGNDERLELLFKPLMNVLRSIPTACLVYLFLVLLGARMTPLFIVVLIAFPILYESVLSGIKSTPIEYLEACRLDGSGIIRENLVLRIPLGFPYILAGIVSTFGLSLKIEIMAEVITGYTRLGIGSAILAQQRSDPTNMVPIFAYGFVVIVLVLFLDLIAFLLKDREVL